MTHSNTSALLDSTPAWGLYTPLQRRLFLAILFLVTASNYFDYYVLSVLIEPIKREFDVSDTMLGILSGVCFSLVYSITAFPIARWADIGNRRTIITVALAGWSLMTAACGFAQSFAQLALARFGAGMVEPGALPPSTSLIADYFHPERRATATTMLVNGASAVGWLVGVGLGGSIAAEYGWRMAFIAAGVPGLVLAVVVRFVLPEPRCRVGFPGSGGKSEGFINSLLGLKRKRSFCLTVIGIALYSIFTYGVMVFIPSFMIRSLHTTLAEVSMPWGAAIAVANIVGALVGGWLADRLGKTDIRWYARLPAAACLVSLPLYGLALLTTHIVNFIAIEFVAELSLSIGVPVSFAAALAVSGSHRRALATTAMLCSMLLIGGTLGPLLSGALSDALRAAFALESLRYSLIAMCGFLLPAAVAFYCASRTIPGDAEA